MRGRHQQPRQHPLHVPRHRSPLRRPDIIVNTVAVFPSPDSAGRITDAQWHSTLTLNVTANYLLADEAAAVLDVQQTPASILRQRGHPWAMGI